MSNGPETVLLACVPCLRLPFPLWYSPLKMPNVAFSRPLNHYSHCCTRQHLKRADVDTTGTYPPSPNSYHLPTHANDERSQRATVDRTRPTASGLLSRFPSPLSTLSPPSSITGDRAIDARFQTAGRERASPSLRAVAGGTSSVSPSTMTETLRLIPTDFLRFRISSRITDGSRGPG